MSELAGPRPDEIELSLLGPGYGESVVVHMGGGEWMVVDSCAGRDGEPAALNYLDRIGVDSRSAVKMIVATHWHDDHTRGMSKIVDRCESARFCCAAALRDKELLAAVDGLGGKTGFRMSSGAREIHAIFSHLAERRTQPIWAAASRRVFQSGGCAVWALSPGDETLGRFLLSVGSLISTQEISPRRVSPPSPNDLSVVLWVECKGAVALLGADLERNGWLAIVGEQTRPEGRASVFKVPHHGSATADVPEVWHRMLEPDPMAILTPWRRGDKALPTPEDVARLLSRTTTAYASADPAWSSENQDELPVRI
ncbi:MAG: hypothetical protein F4Z31_05445 [Gemmatimonadetes bacterium]|nr:hypothetical protein [Gemmatimonadota bacterium]MYE94460.1 hypothetical protein [Gemmatimonadota bacterium]MYJ11253.1 hypothetical protein [Gemmatimonadota bacterium]